MSEREMPMEKATNIKWSNKSPIPVPNKCMKQDKNVSLFHLLFQFHIFQFDCFHIRNWERFLFFYFRLFVDMFFYYQKSDFSTVNGNKQLRMAFIWQNSDTEPLNVEQFFQKNERINRIFKMTASCKQFQMTFLDQTQNKTKMCCIPIKFERIYFQ